MVSQNGHSVPTAFASSTRASQVLFRFVSYCRLDALAVYAKDDVGHYNLIVSVIFKQL